MNLKITVFFFLSAYAMLSSGAAERGRVNDADCDWIDVSGLEIGGRGYVSAEEPFVRFPKAQRATAPEKVRSMSRQSTGLNFRFRTTSKKLVFRYTVEKRGWTDPLIPPSGLQSVSVWGRDGEDGEWEYVCKNHPKADGDNEYVVQWRPSRTGWLYFPMRAVVKTFKIGIERGTAFETVPFANPGKVVIYGTSIVHGGCVSSGGMMFTSFMGRRLDRDVVALGFSGAGKMEAEMADLLSGIDADLYIVDCDWNMSVKLQKERYEPFLRRLRSARPATPILLCGGCTEKRTPRDQEAYARSVYERLKSTEGELWSDLHFLSGVAALPKCSWATHDHCHPNDLGAPFMGEVYARKVVEILAAGKRDGDGKKRVQERHEPISPTRSPAERVGVPASLYDHAEPVNLPELMETSDGRPVSGVWDWESVRRPEILRFATENIYGIRPVERPDDLRFDAVGTDMAFPESGMIRRRVRASFSGPRGKWSFGITAFMPATASSAVPVPAFLLICNRPMEKFADPDRDSKSGFFPAEDIVARGYAAIVFQNTDLALDRYYPYRGEDGTAVIQDPSFTNGFYACWAPERTERSWGAISAWAWGASRVMDWIETEPRIDAGRVAVVGHSRGGKTSLWAAALDTRFAMACVNNSGCCGAKLNHVATPCSETIQQDNNNNPHWFCRAYRRFNGLDAHIPYDQHWIAALLAPRLLYIASASGDTPAGPWGEFLTARHASPAWKLYGKEGLVENHPYRIGDPFHQGCVGYHLRAGNHDLTLEDWKNYMDFADRHGWIRR